MPKPRYSQISLEATPYYHCISRCVRRAFLCGIDSFTGKNYEHRRQLIEDKILELGLIFSIDICAYTVMSNHYHVVLHISENTAKKWSDNEIINRWHKLFSGNPLSKKYLKGTPLSTVEKKQLLITIDLWRERLMSISWFMRVLNESVARQSNKEDECTGRFWEGRYKSQALLDEASLVTCMVYVDLNPIRANIADTVEASNHTSIQLRIKDARNKPNTSQHQSHALFPFIGSSQKGNTDGLPFQYSEYLKLVDWTGRIILSPEKGHIDSITPPIIERLNMESRSWIYLCRNFESPFKGFVGSVIKLRQACEKLGYQRIPGVKSCEMYFP